MRITLDSIDQRTLDNATRRLTQTIRLAGGELLGPTPMPRKFHGEHVRVLTLKQGVHEIRVVEALGIFHLPLSVNVRVETQVL